MIPAWLLGAFTAVMLAVAGVSTARIATARPWRGGPGAVRADIDVAHLLMAIAMAGTLTPALRTLPGGAWEAIFGVLAAWFAYRVARDAQVSGFRALASGHCAPHLIHATAMLYMFLALTAPTSHGGGMSGMGGAAASTMGTLALPALAFIFTLLLVGYSVWDLDQLSGPGPSGHYSLAMARVAPAAAVLAGVGAPAGPGAVAVSAPASGQGGSVRAGEPVTGPPARPARAGAPASGNGRGVLAPWVAASCRIAMGITMGFMLVIMI
jgi:hypothetical protein